MPRNRTLLSALLLVSIFLFGSSCSLWNKAFGPKYGCPAGSAVGAEKLLSGQKVPKQKKFKA